MASEPSNIGGPPFPTQLVANVFVYVYYRVLGISSGYLFNFYKEDSIFGRSGPYGGMISVTGFEAINEALIALNSNLLRVVVRTVDGQESINGSIIVGVTGFHVRIDNVAWNFTRTFFLAPQENGYYVSNDIFRYVGEARYYALPSGDNEPRSPELETPQDPDGQGSIASEVEVLIEESVFAPPTDEDIRAFEESPDVEVAGEIPISYPAAPIGLSNVVLEFYDTPEDEDALAFEESLDVEVVDEILNSSQATPDSSSAVAEDVYNPREDEDASPFRESPVVYVFDEIRSSPQAALPDPSSSAVLEDVYDPPEDEGAPPLEESPAVDVLDEILTSSQAAYPDSRSSAVLEDVYGPPEGEDVPPLEESPAVDVLDKIPTSSQAPHPDPRSSAVLEDVYVPPEGKDVPPFEESPAADVLDQIPSSTQSSSHQSSSSILGAAPKKSSASVVNVLDQIPSSTQSTSHQSSSSSILGAAPKSYASVVNVLDQIPSSTQSSSHQSSSSSILGAAPKKSYAFVVKGMKENPAAPAVSSPVPSGPEVANIGTQITEDVGYSICMKNLPSNVTPAQVEEEFKKFGPIKPGGTSIRIPKHHRSGFGFLQFEVASAVEAAIKASPIKIGGREVSVEEKQSKSSENNTEEGGSGGPSSVPAAGTEVDQISAIGLSEM